MPATQQPAAAPARASSTPRAGRNAPAADAARHLLLRRLAPALKHDMVVHLQAVAMLTEMLGARLERGSAGADEMQSSIAKLNRLSRDAVADCLKVASWLDAAADDEAVPLHQAMAESAKLLAANLNFHGFVLSNQVAETQFEVARGGARGLIAACLVLLMDSAPQPCNIVVVSHVSPADALLRFARVPLQEEPLHVLPQEIAPTAIEWADVQALAAAAGAAVARDGDGLQLSLPRAQVTSPVQMAPV